MKGYFSSQSMSILTLFWSSRIACLISIMSGKCEYINCGKTKRLCRDVVMHRFPTAKNSKRQR